MLLDKQCFVGEISLKQIFLFLISFPVSDFLKTTNVESINNKTNPTEDVFWMNPQYLLTINWASTNQVTKPISNMCHKYAQMKASFSN